MTHGRQYFAEFMLQHIGEILEKYPIIVGEYTLGQRVRAIKNWDGGYIIETVGTVCGIEFLENDDYSDAGIYYYIEVESSKALFPDGRLMGYGHDKCERILAEYVKPINTPSVIEPLKVTV